MARVCSYRSESTDGIRVALVRPNYCSVHASGSGLSSARAEFMDERSDSILCIRCTGCRPCLSVRYDGSRRDRTLGATTVIDPTG